ncbi:Phosphoribosylanthranilate isomerase [Melioribacter roseus P3M-2]|uniref:N-(5'-phosphoribosyl)anthranilate isomerase n=1 Tax=Melioribacter roseus (strain DSM 23840 / JCM 17771 / VKM B-2668 / P3M-2) TaxID=1191523 RepID=I6ZRH3_MELRP|nr:phosphoribosylanthranilate isomerase [Melioribacter roseus]AFN74674.1 Phosphoribosylanthranilate isomerase [Melioribacter roseus P3M-2]
MHTRVKICCVNSIEEAWLAIEFGASAIGLVGKMPSGPGIIPDDLIRKIASEIPPPVSTFLLTSETSADKIVEHHSRTHTSAIQIVDEVETYVYASIRKALPSVKIVQVVHVTGEESIDKAVMISENVDLILLDSGNPNLKIKELGGTGRTHNWKISRKIVEQSTAPVFLAGGLNPENINRAIEEVNPFGVDVCSGVRTGGKLDPLKLEKFFAGIS